MKSSVTQALQGYEILNILYEGPRTLVYQALRKSDQRVVVIKTFPKHFLLRFFEYFSFRNQFIISHHLEHPGIVRILSLESVDNTYALIMEDVQGISLAEFLQSSRSLMNGLQIAVQLADILHYLGQQRVIHKDIKPTNILINPQTLQVKLIDFGIASLLPQETQDIKNPNALEGSLAYMAPEQTGRMNRGIDFRSDFYSLGVTLFELFAGQLPFQADEPMAWLHCHIAQIPPSLTTFGVPATVAAIVNKLLEKNIEDRYQSALGLKHDLECCLTRLMDQGEVVPFELGMRDVCDRILVPEKLYGREAEIKALLDAFERLTQGSAELVMVTGFSGIGKTAVVNEIHKPITLQKGYFIQGKFDQYNRNIPFSAFVQAFRDLVRQLLGETDRTLSFWKQKILGAVGANGQVILDVIPELEHIIGAQPRAPKLSGTAVQNRFNLVFGKFVQVFTAADHPLVIFLDDLQWVDSASLNLLKVLLVKTQTTASGYLLVLGAYRDNEVLPGHPLLLTLEELRQQDVPVHTLTLLPLIQADINQLVADTLSCSADITEPLAKFVYQKTRGNPFFTTQFLTGLQRDGLITFDPEPGHWQCDLTEIQSLSLTNSVVDYLVKRLQMLPTATQEILKVAACMGHQFDLDTLAVVCATSPEQVATDLWQSLQAGLVIPEGNTYKFFQGDSGEQTPENTTNKVFQNISESSSDPTDLATFSIQYRFLHDRVQQAAYQLIPEGQTQQVHLDIGRRWLRETSLEQQADQLFDIISQLNLGRRLVHDYAERQTLIQLNLNAAKQAISTTAYETAHTCLQVCQELLSPDSWQTQYDLTLDIYNVSVETTYLQGNWAGIEALALTLEQQAQDPLDLITVYERKIEVKTIQGKFSEAITLGLQSLKTLGLHFPDQLNDDDCKTYLQETQRLIAGRSAPEILNLPRTMARHPQALIGLLSKILQASYHSNPNLYALLGLKRMQLALAHGNTTDSAICCLGYGILTCNVLNDIETSYSFGQAALQRIEQLEPSSQTANAILLFHAFINHWKQPIAETLSPLQRAYTVALDMGELVSAGYAAYLYGSHAYFAGHELASLKGEIEHHSQAVAAINQDTALDYNRILYQAILMLLGESSDLTQWVGKTFDKTVDIAQFEKDQNNFGLWCLYTHRLKICYLFENFDSALYFYQQAHDIAKSGLGSINTSILYWEGTLTCLALLFEQSRVRSVQVSQLQQWIAIGKEKLQLWATHNPHYYQHKYDLVCAESYRLAGDRLAALEAYDQAILGAKANGYLQDEALANELASKFYLDWGKEKIAATYLQDAYTCYAAWGAKAKTKDLEQRYPHFLQPLLQKKMSVINPIETLANIASPQVSSYSSVPLHGTTDVINDSFDFAAVLKAAQTLTQTIKRDELLQNLSQIILQNSGGDYLILVLPNSEQNWEIQATATPITIELCVEPLAGNSRVPVKLIQYVKNTHELFFADHLDTAIPIIDPYLQEQCPQSFLCAPLTVQDELLGVLYLQSSTTRGLISPDRLVTLNFLFSQVAIGLNNLKAFEEALALKSKVIEASIDGMAILEEGQFIYLNQALLTLYGYTEDELYGEGWEKLYAPTEVQRLYKASVDTITETGQWTGEATALRKNGTTFAEEVSLVRLDDGKLIYICRDISERKYLEAKRQKLIQILQFTSEENAQLYAESQEQTRRLQESQRKLEQIILQTPAAVIEWNPDFEFQTWNPAAEEIFGFSAEEVAGKHFRLIVPLEQQDYVQDIAINILHQTGGCHSVNENITKDGRSIICEWFNAPKLDAQGNIYGGISIVLDISDRKAAEQALKDSQARFQHITENIPGMIYHCVLHPDGTDEMTYISAQVREVFELEPETVLKDGGRTMWDRTHPDDISRIKADVQRSVETLKPFKNEHRLILPHKGLRWIQASARPELLENGDVVFDGVSIDISDRKAAEQAVMQQQTHLKALLNNIPQIIWLKDIDGRYIAINETYEAVCGIKMDEIVGRTDFELLPIELAQSYLKDDAQVLASGQRKVIVEKFARADGTLGWLETTKTPFQDDQGKWAGTVGIAADITDRKAAELALKDSQAQFRHMTENVPGMIYRYILHTDGRDELTYASSQVRELFELEPEIALQDIAKVWERVHPDDMLKLREALQESAETLQPHRSEHRLILPKKGLRWVQLFAQPERLDHGDVVWDGVLVDISDQKIAEEKLQQSHDKLTRTNQELVRATQHKGDFLANMSHELRTPLNAVLGFSQLMQRDSSMSSDHQEMLDTINRNGEYLLALINDILEMSKIEAGKITLNPTQVDLPQFLDDIHEILKFKTEAKSLQLKVLYAPEMPRYVQVDAVKLRQILLNLMGNALKFTQQGQINLHAKVVDRNQGAPQKQVHLQFAVSDTGPGIKSEDLDNIFQPFIQSVSGKRSHQGTGLGLPISRKFAGLMGGNIQVESVFGQGSTFYCDILAEVSVVNHQSCDAQSQQHQNIQGLKKWQSTYRLLVVDDNADNRELLSQMLSITGFEVWTAVSGSQAVVMNESWQPHLICMDICMPQMDGLEATRQIRRSSYNPKILAVTANAFIEDHQAAIAAGCDDFIAKPFTKEMVFQRVAQLLEVEFAVAPEPSPSEQSQQTAQFESQDALVQVGFRSMPVEWQERLGQSVRTLDDHSIRVLLADVPAEYGGMVDAVSLLLKDYRYDILMNILNIQP